MPPLSCLTIFAGAIQGWWRKHGKEVDERAEKWAQEHLANERPSAEIVEEQAAPQATDSPQVEAAAAIAPIDEVASLRCQFPDCPERNRLREPHEPVTCEECRKRAGLGTLEETVQFCSICRDKHSVEVRHESE
jgi:hypothetical protein